MEENEHTLATRSPRKLIRRLHQVAVIATLLIITLTVLGTYKIYQGYVTENAEANALAISQSIVALDDNILLHPAEGKGSRLIVDESEIALLDRYFKSFLAPYDILKIKVFSPDRFIVYSTDKGIIGLHDRENERLASALNGISNAKMQTRREVYDLKDEKRFDVDVVETYVPIRNERNEIVGSFEIYQDMTKYRDDVNRGVFTSAMIITAIVASVFTLAYLMLRLAASQLDQAQQELHKLATVDALTGMLNRREIMRQANTEFARFKRNRPQKPNTHFSLIMADIDHFKSINDSYGHQMGDRILQQTAYRIASELREYSALGRYGGEEFMVVLPDSNLKVAIAVAERIRSAVREIEIDVGSRARNISISLGVATATEGEDEFEDILRRADQGLYRAKKNGRNQVAWVSDSGQA